MSLRTWLLAGAFLSVGTAATAQPPSPLPDEIRSADLPTITPVSANSPAVEPKVAASADTSPIVRELTLASQRGAGWLFRAHQIDGRFLPGFRPSVRRTIEEDTFLNQAVATFALARAARFTGDADHATRAAQAIVRLRDQTTLADGARHPNGPSHQSNRLGGAGMLVLAICELPEPPEELLDHVDEMCRFLVSRQRADGAFDYTDDPQDDPLALDPAGVNTYPGMALYALARSATVRPAEWKSAAVLKAMPFYQSRFRKSPDADFVTWQAAAYAEEYLRTKDRSCAAFVFEMTDWLLGLQYSGLDSRQALYRGGFQVFRDGKPTGAVPTIDAAGYAQAIACACRVTRHVPDRQRFQTYRTALIRATQFVVSLQYAEENTQHFTPEFRGALSGGFHVSPEEGTLRVEHTAMAVAMLIRALESGAF